ncbi:MAG TPA: chemotaxis protein CheW [Verrucomicrobiota bacterium]|nr:chemotaxis protein CheW [Verrucomicrobiota bacterium]
MNRPRLDSGNGKPENELPGSEELLKKLELLSGTAISAATARQRIKMFRDGGDVAGERAFWERICASMWDVSAFMKLLKQRFTQWFNRQKGRKGALWEERFKSVLVEGADEALATMAGYIDLNPVRAGLVDDPKDYRWCGYAEATSGSRRAQRGLRAIIAGGEHVAESKTKLHQALAKYRVWLFGQGEEREGTTPAGQPLRRGFKREDVLAVVAARGRLAVPDYLRLKVRYFADGAILGVRSFVDCVFRACRTRFGPQRKDGARRMQGLQSELFTVRDLQRRVIA